MDALADAISLYRSGRLREAERACRELLALRQDHGDALALLGDILLTAGRPAAAVEALRALSALRPADAGNLRRLGSALAGLQCHSEAIEALRRAVGLEPDNARGWNNLGQVLVRAGQAATAIAHLQRAITLQPHYAIAYANLGQAFSACRQAAAALRAYRRAAELDGALFEAWMGCATVELELGRAPQALDAVDRALILQPAHPPALHLRAAILCDLHRPEEALVDLERILSRDPGSVAAWCERAIAYQHLGDPDAAIASFQRAIGLDADAVAARCGLLGAVLPSVPLSTVQDGQARAQFLDELAAFETWFGARERCEDDAWTAARQHLFYLSYQPVSSREPLQRYRRATALQLQRALPGSAVAARIHGRIAPGRRHRLGIASAHVCDHSVFNAIVEGWLAHLDRSRFEISLFSLGARRDAATQAAAVRVDHFEAGARTPREWADLIRARDLDSLVFPEVGIDRASLALANLRLAGRQYASWGHPDTTGLPTIDAYLSAERFEPADADEHYSERLIRLPNLGVWYTPRSAARSPVDLPGLGIHSGPVLVCPGTPFKYRPEDDAVLIQIAKHLGSCTFVFFEYERAGLSRRLRERISGQFRQAGLDPEALLVWVPWLPRAAFLSLLDQADVCLDTIGFSGFNTMMQAVEAALPAVAFEGRFLRGRLGSGILQHLGLGEWVAVSHAEFVDRVVALARSKASRRAIRDHLRIATPRAFGDRLPVAALADTLEELR